jgi:hypothetical protein
MSKYNDPLVDALLEDPRVVGIQKQFNDFVAAEYAKLDSTEFVGEVGDSPATVQVVYCTNKKGLCQINVSDSVYTDKAFTLTALPLAINDAMIKYNAEWKAVEHRIRAYEQNVYQQMVNIALDKQKPQETVMPTKKTYLN